MFEPKPLTREGIPRALERAERYRLLNEPVEAESICLDVLGAEPNSQPALVTLPSVLLRSLTVALRTAWVPVGPRRVAR